MSDLVHTIHRLTSLLRDHPELLHDAGNRQMVEELVFVLRDALALANTAELRMALLEFGEILTEDDAA